ncbi:response regulator [Brevibacillus centrosporus]|uniref:Transcriptional regulatory protein n=1 Tax=Brevibacillus centrosporus TaxID=54910 RepID=A0A1I3PET3_9BACL|nr:response regulator [Brevibacillus centrosporus]MEC2128647.1 response regulator [Brevibacillus centrosporus]MED4910882.1 response regulator [Brevibacillus centrosporus]RNB73531.1 response regulator [Brevibacillus centrosporus]SFJ20002.1 two-component system, CitB family, response regulator [Brevibacillus centrosporus]GED29224.1 two-component system response regulator [Brevibacillus centrosporus]
MQKVEVLIVEDDLRIIDINRRFVSKIEGFDVIATATNGAEAKELLSFMQPHLVLLDVYLPDMLGTDLVWHVRQHHRSVDIMMITAAKEIEMVQEALRGGVYDYIVKPLVFERFRERLESYRQHLWRTKEVGEVDQEVIDRILTRNLQAGKTRETAMPKGIDLLTLEKVIQAIRRTGEKGVSAEEIGKVIGTSRTTARRYLEYLVLEKKARADLLYGTVGRPERKYRYLS